MSRDIDAAAALFVARFVIFGIGKRGISFTLLVHALRGGFALMMPIK